MNIIYVYTIYPVLNVCVKGMQDDEFLMHVLSFSCIDIAYL